MSRSGSQARLPSILGMSGLTAMAPTPEGLKPASPIESRSISRTPSSLGMPALATMATQPEGFKPTASSMTAEDISTHAATLTACERAQSLLNGNSFSSMGSVTSQGWAVGEEGGAIRTARASSFQVAPQVGEERPWMTRDI